MARMHTKASKKRKFKKRYLTRSQSKRLLQVDNRDFKRLCILKGVYPRQPMSYRNSSGKDKVYYLTKDVKWIVSDPILEGMRSYETHTKKLRKLRGSGKQEAADTMDETKRPQYKLDKTIRERYPTFSDALRDLSDALSGVYLYAILPPQVRSDTTVEGHAYHTTWLHDECVSVTKRWKEYVESQRLLQKGFISIKGFYYQAIVRGDEATWLVPHDFTSKHPKAVEHHVMLTFLEFYVHFLRFVLFKLEADARTALTTQDEEDVTQSVAFEEKKATATGVKQLFEGLIFFISRESVPDHMAFVVKCLGGSIAPSVESPGVTHYVVDRPTLPMGEKKLDTIEYIQPQYIFDCLNARVLLPVEAYGIGVRCPPHISPFTTSIRNNENEFSLKERVEHRDSFLGDVPDRVHEVRRLINPSYVVGSKPGDDDEDLDSIDLEGPVMKETDHNDDDDDDDEEEDDTIREVPHRSKDSARQVQKQREGKLTNAPTDESVAAGRLAKQKTNKLAQQNASREEKIALKKQLTRTQQEEQKQGAMSLLTKKVRGVYVAASKSQKRTRDKAENLEDTRSKLKAGATKVNPRGYLEDA